MTRARSIRGYAAGLLVLGLAACGGEASGTPSMTGTYVLDRVQYASTLEQEQAEAHADQIAALGAEERVVFLATLREAGRATARAVSLRLDLRVDGSFVISYQFGKERGSQRGAWEQRGEEVSLRVTHDAAGPVQRGAAVTATRGPQGLRFAGWPVPHAFLLRPE